MAALGNPLIAAPPFVPVFDNEDLLGVEIFDDSDGKIDGAFDLSPVAARMHQQARAVVAHAASSA
ncbi:hypothetical protein [Achromobacter denitrificans]|uniref:hypothetical protein n=1 Tax=Achromobacter denitrificans TaxID=32002 RepID=UPI003CFFE28B